MRLQQTFWKEWMTFMEKAMESMVTMGKLGTAAGEESVAPWKLYQNWFDSFQKVFAESEACLFYEYIGEWQDFFIGAAATEHTN